MAGEKLVNLMVSAGRTAANGSSKTDLMYGRVASISPLRIQVENEPKLVLSSSFLILSDLCKSKTVTLPALTMSLVDSHQHTFEDTNGADTTPKTSGAAGSHTHTINSVEITLWPGLQVGDRVAMLRVESGHKFYVLQRVEE